MITNYTQLKETIEKSMQKVKITDLHTHIYSEKFDKLLLWGIDELLTYHYLIAEYFRYSNLDYNEFFALSKSNQADIIWDTLFIKNSPVSEAQRGVLTILKKLGLDVQSRDLKEYRKYFSKLTTKEYIDKVFEISGVSQVVMTNDPFDPLEKPIWDAGGNEDERFKAALRIDSIVNQYEKTYKSLIEWGYEVSENLNEKSILEIRRFLTEWVQKTKSLYMAVSLPPSFKMPEDSTASKVIENCVIPVCRQLQIPFAMMIGVKKLINYELGLAGDSVGKSDITTVEYLCKTYPQNKFMITMLSKENQHELAITARKFRNLMVFGCWWFLNNPSIIEDMTRMRMETLGLSFIPQHSDARVLDQLIYKWTHSKKIISNVLLDKYNDILSTGWTMTEEEVDRDISALVGGNFWSFINK